MADKLRPSPPRFAQKSTKRKLHPNWDIYQFLPPCFKWCNPSKLFQFCIFVDEWSRRYVPFVLHWHQTVYGTYHGSFRSIGLGNSRITSPLPAPTGAYRAGCMSAAAKRYKVHSNFAERHLAGSPFNYAHFSTCVGFFTSVKWTLSLHFGRYIILRNIFQQLCTNLMIFLQMLYLFYRPQQVYRNFQYRKVSHAWYRIWGQKPPFPNIWMKETKAQYARDDPAFLVLLSAVLIVTSAGFSFTLGEPSYFSECLGNYWFSNTFRYSLLGLCQVPALRDICWYGEILLFRNIRFVILVQNCVDDHPHVILIADDNLPRWAWAWFSPLCSGGSATPSSSSLLTGIRLYHWSSWHENAFHQLWFAHSMKTIMIILVAIGVCDKSAI